MCTYICIYTHAHTHMYTYMGFPGGSVVKYSPTCAGNFGSFPGLERSPGEGNGNPLPYSCLGNPMGREAWQASVYGVAKELDMPE